ncbi:hypothetical protein C8Q74DRAFT_1253199 [Fomes fomentarius]|nr:hypothetical protein C8Q74DRAFT_1253199 [Fomes fomentarius]
MPARSHIRPSLPQSLLEEIHGNDSAHKHKHKGGQQPSRKEARKQARESRKQRKAEHFSAAPVHKPAKRRAEDDHTESPQRKKTKLESVGTNASRPLPLENSTSLPQQEQKRASSGKAMKTKSVLEKLAELAEGAKVTKQRSQPSLNAILRTSQDEEEDAYIAYLERKLGWVKGGKRTSVYGKGDEDDGLDGAFHAQEIGTSR